MKRYPTFSSLVFLLAINEQVVGQNRPVQEAVEKVNATVIERNGWHIKSEVQAIAKSRAILTLAEPEKPLEVAELVRIAADNTPYLGAQISGRPVWRVTVHKCKLRFAEPRLQADLFVDNAWEVFLDPRTGSLLRVQSVPGQPMQELLREPDAENATQQLRNAGKETYHAFPDEPPRIGFVEALSMLVAEGEPVIAARRIEGQYIEWSEMDRPHRLVWAITLRSIRLPIVERRGAAAAPVYCMRFIIDATTGKMIFGTNIPVPSEE